MPNSLLYLKLKYLRYSPGIQGSRDVKLQASIGKMESKLNVCLHLKTALQTSTGEKELTKLKERYMHTVRSIAKTQ